MLAVERAAYLTMDDGPTEDFMEKVEYLNGKGIRAIWFCAGEALERFSEEAKHAIKTGHVIGNRSYDCADFSAISLLDVRGQLERSDRIIEQLYAEADVERPSKAFRYPYVQDETNDEHFAAIERLLEQLGYQQPSFEKIRYAAPNEASMKPGIHVSCTLDTFDLAADGALSGGGDSQASNGNEIIMIHDWISAEPFKALVDKLLAMGLAFRLPKETSLNVQLV
ncbi:polysaccharide deacetylase family protein [Paenibacillus sp. PL91]|uniref:polysaccharide deacetylase family protein n=1 Tax=Paenibacillus sp. PL91 TaxID=2729538 RepID=UPI00145CAD73|nr:polysaccharide deacetylase family protein [Paenibacillus sp. PL91]MBC9204546.1 polysaccharide deacetylase family protein [Paenibacillus sp. PL91]